MFEMFSFTIECQLRCSAARLAVGFWMGPGNFHLETFGWTTTEISKV